MTEANPLADGAAYRKAALIQDALQTLRNAHVIDERDDLDAASFLEWYDKTLPDVRDIKILAGAMEVELAKRRGARIIAEGDRRGRPDNLTQRVRLSDAAMSQRSRDRILNAESDAVDAFVQREVTAGRVPTVRGAIGVASAARATAAPHRLANQAVATQFHQSKVDEETLAAITKVADGLRRTDDQIAKVTGYGWSNFFQRIRLIPWLRIDRTHDGFVFHIDEPLRAICDSLRPRPELSYTSVAEYLHSLRDEIARKRKENRDERQKAKWNSQLILTRVQSDLLDWIEDQLDRVPPR